MQWAENGSEIGESGVDALSRHRQDSEYGVMVVFIIIKKTLDPRSTQ